jgi:hypothetical protein
LSVRGVLLGVALLAGLVVACSSSDATTTQAGVDSQGAAGASGASGGAGGSGGEAGGAQAPDGGDGFDGGAQDAAPKADAHPCVDSFGTEMTATFGRLDGMLYSAVIPPDQTCAKPNGDHLILEVAVNGAVYRLLINAQSDQAASDARVYLGTAVAPLPGAPWSEGWHSSGVVFDYPNTVGVHAESFQPYGLDALVEQVMAAVEFDQPISIYTFGYGPDGGHKIHRNSGPGTDGAIVVGPTTASPRFLMFRFAEQAF